MIAIHHSPGTFSDRWIELCQARGIPFKKVDCLSTDVIAQCRGSRAVLWHWLFKNSAEQLVARQIIASLERAGLTVFPNSATCWHYDDKVGQKYLLEAVQAPFIPTWAFTEPFAAQAWIQEAHWPKVFKLRRGAGSINVQLVRSKRQAMGLCRQAFRSGFRAHGGYFCDARTRLRKVKTWDDLWGKVRRAPKSLRDSALAFLHQPREQGYVYFQEFLPGNTYDTRVTVIGGRAFGYIRHNRPGDFRASGSGLPNYDPQQIDARCVRIAFEVAEKLGSQSLAFDFLLDTEHAPRISEVSYCYLDWMVNRCPGYWDRALKWHPGHHWPQAAILDDLVASIELGETSPSAPSLRPDETSLPGRPSFSIS